MPHLVISPYKLYINYRGGSLKIVPQMSPHPLVLSSRPLHLVLHQLLEQSPLLVVHRNQFLPLAIPKLAQRPLAPVGVLKAKYRLP